MKKYLILFVFFNFTYAQYSDLSAEMINDLEKNMSAYRFYYSNEITTPCYPTIKINIDKYFLNKDQHYDIFIKKRNDTIKTTIPIVFYEIYNNYYSVKKDNIINVVGFTHRKSYVDSLTEKFLIGVYNDNIFFISGNLFKNCISEYFNLDINNLKTFYPFLELKLYNYNISNITVEKKYKSKILFKAYSKTLGENILIKIKINEYDLLKVKGENSGWTELGTYNWDKKSLQY